MNERCLTQHGRSLARADLPDNAKADLEQTKVEDVFLKQWFLALCGDPLPS